MNYDQLIGLLHKIRKAVFLSMGALEVLAAI